MQRLGPRQTERPTAFQLDHDAGNVLVVADAPQHRHQVEPRIAAMEEGGESRLPPQDALKIDEHVAFERDVESALAFARQAQPGLMAGDFGLVELGPERVTARHIRHAQFEADLSGEFFALKVGGKTGEQQQPLNHFAAHCDVDVGALKGRQIVEAPVHRDLDAIGEGTKADAEVEATRDPSTAKLGRVEVERRGAKGEVAPGADREPDIPGDHPVEHAALVRREEIEAGADRDEFVAQRQRPGRLAVVGQDVAVAHPVGGKAERHRPGARRKKERVGDAIERHVALMQITEREPLQAAQPRRIDARRHHVVGNRGACRWNGRAFGQRRLANSAHLGERGHREEEGKRQKRDTDKRETRHGPSLVKRELPRIWTPSPRSASARTRFIPGETRPLDAPLTRPTPTLRPCLHLSPDARFAAQFMIDGLGGSGSLSTSMTP